MKRGFLYGETAPERPCLVTKNPVSLTDLHATILHLMGISPKTAFDVERRPFYVTEDGKGQPIAGFDGVKPRADLSGMSSRAARGYNA